MTFGLHGITQDCTIDDLRKLWTWADTAGFDWISTADHFEEAPPKDRNSDVFEAVAVMAAIAAATRHVRVGCLVFCVNFRNPGLLAKSLSTIDHLSGGRVECGLGAGWHENEHRAFGLPFERIGIREDRLEEYAQCLRLLFDQPVASFRGTHFTLDEARCNPKPVQPHVRIWIGGGGEKRTLPAAAKYADGWNCPYTGIEDIVRKLKLLDELCERHGRDPKSLSRTANAGFYMGIDAASAARGRKTLEAWGGHLHNRTGFLLGTPSEVIDQVATYRETGVDRLSIGVRAPFAWEALQAFAEDVMPKFGVGVELAVERTRFARRSPRRWADEQQRVTAW